MRTFAEIVELTGARKSGANWLAKCRAHDDSSPSLAIATGDDGRILLRCHAGCSVEAVLAAFELTWEDVLPERKRTAPRETSWTIRDANGNAIAEHVRIDEPTGRKRFVWRRNGESGLGGLAVGELPLYRTELLDRAGRAVWICEGERAADAAAKLGLNALGTVTGATATPTRGVLAVLKALHVILWPDFDAPGIAHMDRVAKQLEGIAASVRWVHIPGARAKDDAADFSGNAEDLRQLLRNEPPVIGGPLVMFGDRLPSAVQELEGIAAGDDSDFVPTGIAGLDRRLGGGFRRGQVALLGAPTGAGKTSLVVQFAMAAESRGLALVVSPEMSAEELVTREIVRRSRKPKWHRAPWMRELLRQEAREAHERAAAALTRRPPNVAVFDSLDVQLSDVVTAAREAHKRSSLSLVALDYAQQLADTTSDRARHLLVGEVGHVAVEMAREFHCAVLVTSQVNTFKDGQAKDYSFRESAILEHKAHLVLLFLVERDARGRVEKATLRARKARDLALFEYDVAFDPATFQIEDPAANTSELRDWTKERELEGETEDEVMI